MDPEQIVLEAMEALRKGEVDRAQEKIALAVEHAGERPDLLHALGAIELQRGIPGAARPLVERALALLDGQGAPEAAEMRAAFGLTLAAVEVAEDRPVQARAAFHRLLAADPQSVEALAGLGRLELACGALDDGLVALLAARAAGRLQGHPEVEALAALSGAVEAWRGSGRPARDLLAAHRDAYCRFFDHHAERMAARGWIAEAARMRRGPDGALVPAVPDGARPYATVRVDLVDPATGQGGQVGDRPMLAALPGFEVLARSTVLLPWAGAPFPLFVSSQCPWDHLPVQLMLVAGDPVEILDPLVGRWYRAGYEGRFGSPAGGRFHFVSEPEPRPPAGVVYSLDLGRARVEAIDALVEALAALHATCPLRRVILGRGHLPA